MVDDALNSLFGKPPSPAMHDAVNPQAYLNPKLHRSEDEPLLYRLRVGEFYGIASVDPGMVWLGKFHSNRGDAICLSETLMLRIVQQGHQQKLGADIPGHLWEAKNVIYSISKQMIAYAFEPSLKLTQLYKDNMLQASSGLVRANSMPDAPIVR
jgi:hypothetical protein